MLMACPPNQELRFVFRKKAHDLRTADLREDNRKAICFLAGFGENLEINLSIYRLGGQGNVLMDKNEPGAIEPVEFAEAFAQCVPIVAEVSWKWDGAVKKRQEIRFVL